MSFLHFTTQQLQGGGKYSTKCKIGNWYEDNVFEEMKYKDYLKKRESSKLVVTNKENKYEKILKRLPLSEFDIDHKEGKAFLTSNHFFMIQNLKTQGFLVFNTDDVSQNHDYAISVTTNQKMNFSCPRSLISIEPYDDSQVHDLSNTHKQNQVICFGEKICFTSHEELSTFKLFLYSQLISPQSYSRFSRNQEVLMTSKKNYYNCWVIEHINPELRFAYNGKPIPIDEPFLIRHCSTGRLLASNVVDYYNDYGREFEVCCFNFMSCNKYQILKSEKDGKVKVDTKMQVELEQNIWRIVDKLE